MPMSAGVSPPTRCAPAKKMPCTVPRSRRGIQLENARAAIGQAPASPAPKRKRTSSIEGRLKAAAVAAVNADHHSTIRVRTDFVPSFSAHFAVGISKIAYASANELKIHPVCDGVSCHSFVTIGAMVPIATRSR